jgi:hypothetical protein
MADNDNRTSRVKPRLAPNPSNIIACVLRRFGVNEMKFGPAEFEPMLGRLPTAFRYDVDRETGVESFAVKLMEKERTEPALGETWALKVRQNGEIEPLWIVGVMADDFRDFPLYWRTPGGTAICKPGEELDRIKLEGSK